MQVILSITQLKCSAQLPSFVLATRLEDQSLQRYRLYSVIHYQWLNLHCIVASRFSPAHQTFKHHNLWVDFNQQLTVRISQVFAFDSSPPSARHCPWAQQGLLTAMTTGRREGGSRGCVWVAEKGAGMLQCHWNACPRCGERWLLMQGGAAAPVSDV